jgi:small subunit ribosomal protein S14
MARLALIISCKNKNESVRKALALGKKPIHKIRAYNRCKLCSRKGGYMRFFGICRICFRELAVNGDIPGIKKSSW